MSPLDWFFSSNIRFLFYFRLLSQNTAVNPLLATVLLLPQPRLQCPDVGALHLGPNPRILHHPRLYNQHLCEFHADGFFRVDGF